MARNSIPRKREFEDLLDNTVKGLQEKSSRESDRFLGLTGRKLEPIVLETMEECAKGTPFDGGIELISGQRFPDIVVNEYYGVEVKKTSGDHWATIGNSVLESTRVPTVKKVYLLFARLSLPIEFRYRSYDECLSGVKVTHSPRYFIDMELDAEETIFNQIGIEYDELRSLDDPISKIISYYRSQLGEGEGLWWLDQGEMSDVEPVSSDILIKIWNSVPQEEKDIIITKSMAYFPELFGNSGVKFNRLSIWLIQRGVVCPNLRDQFTGGGQLPFEWRGEKIKIPHIYGILFENLQDIINEIEATSNETLSELWDNEVSAENKIDVWIDLLTEQSKSMLLPSLPSDIGEEFDLKTEIHNRLS